MKIEKMVIDHYPYVKSLWKECDLTEEPEDQIEEVKFLLNSSQGTGFVAQQNENIVGAVLCGNDGRYGYIHHLAVSKSLRKHGIGRLLVEQCLKFLQRKHVLIMVRESNEIGNGFWNHLKFEKADWVKVKFLKTK